MSPRSIRTAAAPAAFVLCVPLLSAQSVLFETSGSSSDSYGQVCDLIGDTDGDGRAEVFVSGWRDDPNGLNDAGSLFLYDGATGLASGIVPGLGVGDHMGYGSSSAGDANGDGVFDICAAADEDDVPGVGSNAGSVSIQSGLDGSELHLTLGEDQGDLFGWSTACVGDVNGDGMDDVCASALNAEGLGSPNNAGSLTVISGADGSILWRVYGDTANGSLGSNVGRVGDVNNDGFADFGGIQGIRARIFSGADASLLHDIPVFGGGGTVGIKLGGGVDVNGDGFDDIITGSSGAGNAAGRVRVWSGADGTLLWKPLGDLANDRMGSSVVGAGDLDGDGYGDFAAGGPGFDVGGNQSGGVRAWSGRTGLAIFTISTGAANVQLGHALGAGHDVDGDGVPDLVASSTQAARAAVLSFVPLGLVPFGTGTPGCNGSQPLLANGVPSVGNLGFQLHTAGAEPGTTAFLALGDTADAAGFPVFGALVHVLPPPLGGFLTLLPTPVADAHGSIITPLPLPNDPGLTGKTVVFQVATIQGAGCAQWFSTSRGLRVTFQ